MGDQIFTYNEAADLLESVREKTRAADERLQQLRVELERAGAESAQARKLKEWMDMVVQDWAEAIQALGAQPKGLWTVDFDSGRGFFYCWTLDEPTLDHFHEYDAGFAGRKPLSQEEKEQGSPLLN